MPKLNELIEVVAAAQQEDPDAPVMAGIRFAQANIPAFRLRVENAAGIGATRIDTYIIGVDTDGNTLKRHTSSVAGNSISGGWKAGSVISYTNIRNETSRITLNRDLIFGTSIFTGSYFGRPTHRSPTASFRYNRGYVAGQRSLSLTINSPFITTPAWNLVVTPNVNTDIDVSGVIPITTVVLPGVTPARRFIWAHKEYERFFEDLYLQDRTQINVQGRAKFLVRPGHGIGQWDNLISEGRSWRVIGIEKVARRRYETIVCTSLDTRTR